MRQATVSMVCFFWGEIEGGKRREGKIEEGKRKEDRGQ